MPFAEAGIQAMTMAEGLPNITGRLYSNYSWCTYLVNGAGNNGAFSWDMRNKTILQGAGGTNPDINSLNFDASRSSSIYGNALTVQSNTIVLIPQLRY